MPPPSDSSTVTEPIRRLAPDAWVDRHGGYLYRYALGRVRRQEVAEELVQETLLAAWRGRAGFAGRSSERSWLTAILKRKVIDWLRATVRERDRVGDAQADDFEAGLAGDGVGHFEFRTGPVSDNFKHFSRRQRAAEFQALKCRHRASEPAHVQILVDVERLAVVVELADVEGFGL